MVLWSDDWFSGCVSLRRCSLSRSVSVSNRAGSRETEGGKHPESKNASTGSDITTENKNIVPTTNNHSSYILQLLTMTVVKDATDVGLEMDSSDEALCEMLGLPSLAIAKATDQGDESCMAHEDDDEPPRQSLDELLRLETTWIQRQVDQHKLHEEYIENSVCVLPESLRVPGHVMRRLTDELVWGSSDEQNRKVDKTYETIQVLKAGQVQERKTLTRLENFCNHHEGWKSLCNDYLRRCISAILGEPMVLYKEKLNLKPKGGSGFAPHVDAPSLHVALGDDGPQTFVTVMVAIDDASTQNGCLRIAKGRWSRDTACQVIPPQEDDNPDAGGRAGAIPLETADELDFHDLVCRGGTIVAFNGWLPHRSGPNQSAFNRRAVFLTYTPASEGGDYHDAYYEKMEALRNEWRTKVGLVPSQISADDKLELDALNTIPRI
jgi:ectoine hydroxylase-related dioxygenase (phytanoyl-CoA dioxygenase family)